MNIGKLFSRVFKTGTNATQDFIQNNPNDCPRHLRNAVMQRQGRPLIEPCSPDSLRNLHLTNGIF